MSRFIHTADWQLGMRALFLSDEARPRYAQDRLEVITRIADLADEQGCEFVVVGGDVFDDNLLDRQVVLRAFEALKAFKVPVYLVPGNHDPLDAVSIFTNPIYEDHWPEHIVRCTSEEPIRVPGSDIVLVPAPWRSKRPLTDLVAEAIKRIDPQAGLTYVVVGHGAVDTLTPDLDDPAMIRVESVEAALNSGTISYVGLGDRHSVTSIGSTGRFWYSGSPLVTDFDEVAPNKVLIVTLDEGAIDVQEEVVGRWTFLEEHRSLTSDEDVERLAVWLNSIDDKHRVAIRLGLTGTIGLAAKAQLDEIIDAGKDLFAALRVWESHSDLHVMPSTDDIEALGLQGFASSTLDELLEVSQSSGPEAEVASDALGLLYRLARRTR